MKVNLLTSDFPNGFTDDFINELNTHLISTKNFVFIASDFSKHDLTQLFLDYTLQLFLNKGIAFENTYIIDSKIPPIEAIEIIEKADVVWLSGGSTLMQIKNINEYGIIEALKTRNGITIGMSAGSINMAKHVVLARNVNDGVSKLSIYDGIGLVNLNIAPHLNEADDEHICDIEEAAKYSPIYGLYDESFIVDIDGDKKIYGNYKLFL